MTKNNDGLTPGQSVDFETLQRVLRDQREARRNAETKPKRATKRRGKRTEDIRQPDEPEVFGVVHAEAPERPESGE